MIKSAVCIVVFAVLFARAHAQSTDSPRKLINNKPPQYPAFLKSMKLEGNVRLRVTVAPNGTPKSSEVLGGNPAFAKAISELQSYEARRIVLIRRTKRCRSNPTPQTGLATDANCVSTLGGVSDTAQEGG